MKSYVYMIKMNLENCSFLSRICRISNRIFLFLCVVRKFVFYYVC